MAADKVLHQDWQHGNDHPEGQHVDENCNKKKANAALRAD
jgi:hypothetical protein